MADKKLLTITPAPHIKSKFTTRRMMSMVLIALLPAFIGSIYFFGLRALWVTLISMVTAVVTEYGYQKLTKKKITAFDGSAALTGILLAFVISPSVPYWIPVVGSFFAILFVKQLFGGIGYNFMNPALAGRAFLMASWPAFMTGKWIAPTGGTLSGIESITTATPLSTLKLVGHSKDVANLLNSAESLKHLFFGNVGGCIGETSALLLLIGGLFLIFINIIDWRIPVAYIGTVFALYIPLYYSGVSLLTPLFHILAGGLIIGAFFMATDPVTSPITKKGRWIFGIGAGLLTVLIRQWGGYPEGVSYSIIIMNMFVPLIEKYTLPKPFGRVRRKA
ncbi:MAG TPA: RnfABCDGE type electron transport complex subunit D [Firmicutes bacterium]|uniref:Ion-translocating oxidoreductase complex subunit D n=1 Tax=candidate division TA06 bacterium TaxID=2250710 RepID=A0A660SA42_UNCT6|nr:MAG: Na+-transporting NADH:ubiquinone oxidoreductase subunit D [candidate division TA06 bacterium]HFD04659.1 RnfABCDGE type electron transport complex subunit D [Bacillota bacterium]